MKRLALALIVLCTASAAWPQTADIAWPQLWARAQRGEAEAQYQIGLRYGAGAGAATNYTAAARWYRKAAEQGHDRAQAALGLLYSSGMGVPLDRGEAVKWYRRAAEQGNADARFNLGLSNWNGDGTTQNFNEAAGLFRKTAPAGSPYARSALGTRYDGSRDTAPAAPPAPPSRVQESTALGPPYGTPTGPPLTPAALFRHHLAAAERGDARSQSQLGYMYGAGYGTARNLIEAHKWSNIAAARLGPGQVRDYSIHNRNAAAVLMTPDQVLQAQALARAWIEAFEKRFGKHWEEMTRWR